MKEFDQRLSPGRLHDACEFLARVGLGYLVLGRQIATLSGGEAQGVTLARRGWPDVPMQSSAPALRWRTRRDLD